MAREGKLVNTQVLQALIKNSVDLDGNFKQLNVTIAQASTVFRNNLTRAISETSKEMGISSGLSNAILLLGENLQYLGVVIVPIVTAAVFSLVTAAIGVADDMVARADAIRNVFRGRRLGNMIVEEVTPPNTERGAILEMEANFMSASFEIMYYLDINL